MMGDSKDKPFFIGYLNMPAQLKKFYLPLVILLIVCASLVGYTIASHQHSAGPAIWQTESTETMSGYLTLEPYPVLHRLDPDNTEQVESILLVNQGKMSAEQFSRPFDRQLVSVTGYPIRRGGWTMLELSVAGDIQADAQADISLLQRLSAAASAKPLGPVTLNGEIADSKCFLGVMKPGIGPVHKACAEVCLSGGIPAMLLVWGDDGQKYGYMLTQTDGSSASNLLSNRAADRVGVSGELLQKGNLLYIRMDKDGIHS